MAHFDRSPRWGPKSEPRSTSARCFPQVAPWFCGSPPERSGRYPRWHRLSAQYLLTLTLFGAGLMRLAIEGSCAVHWKPVKGFADFCQLGSLGENIMSESLTWGVLRGVKLRLKLCSFLIGHLGCWLLWQGLLVLHLLVFSINVLNVYLLLVCHLFIWNCLWSLLSERVMHRLLMLHLKSIQFCHFLQEVLLIVHAANLTILFIWDR